MKVIKYTTISRIFLLLIIGVSNYTFAQQEPQFTQYMDNQLYINPAYAGSRSTLNIGGIHRQQWTGFKGAPMTQTIFAHSPLPYESIGLGGSVINDRVGPLNQTWINLDVSYSLKFKNGGKLAFGVKGGMNLVNGRFSELETTTAGDPAMISNYVNRVLPNFGGGIMYHSENWFVGASVPKILQPKGFSLNTLTEQRHYYVIAGGYLNLSEKLKLRPSTLIKITENAPLSWDMNLAFIINQKWWLGANYRLLESAGGFVQFQISNKFKIGYAFDISTTSLVRYNYGTHEITLGYDLVRKKGTLEAPRFF